jgi:small subunit ribosomal protein S3Ae
MAKSNITSWKQKRPYVIVAPEKFDYQELGVTVASDPKMLVGRTITVSLADLAVDRAKQHLLVVFEICEVAGDKAKTSFKKFALNPGYLKSKVRKGMSKIDYQTELELSDGRLSVKLIILAVQNISSPKNRDIVSSIGRVLAKYKEVKMDEFVQQVLFGKVGTDVYRKIKKICPISRVEVFEVRKV